MPLYEYECTECGQRSEKIRRFSDPPLTKCEKCGGKLKQLVSRSAIKFKGSGWYVTDYARKPTVSANSSAGSGNGSKEKGSEGAKKEVPSGGQKSEVGSKKSGDRSQESEARSQNKADSSQKSGDRTQKES